MEFPELEGWDHHCYLAECSQVDFLPFTCDCCSNVFCLEHRSYDAHRCPKAGNKSMQALVCPLCAKAVLLVAGEDPNVTFERHQRDGCDTDNYRRVNNKARCPVKGCSEKLTFSNTHACKSCAQKVCLKHRFPDDHACSTVKVSGGGRTAAASGFLQSMFHRASTSSTSSSARKPTREPVPPRPTPTAAGARLRAAGAVLSEICPHCGASFLDVSALIAHVEAYHPAPSSSPAPVAPRQPQDAATSTGREVCPQCSKSFADVSALISHVDQTHASPDRKSATSDCIVL